MYTNRVLLASAFALAVMVPTALGWGPISHATFNCLGMGETDVASCIAKRASGVFAASSDMPDAFGFGAFNITRSPDSGYLCGGLTYVHDPVFAGHQILLAQNYTGSWPALEYATAFAGHIMGDFVGFSAAGVLCTSEASECNGREIRYMPEWGYMAAIDAYYFHVHGLAAVFEDLPVTSKELFPIEAVEFIADATAAYNTINPSFGKVSPDAVRQCTEYWAPNMQYVYDRANFYSKSKENVAFLIQELEFFKPSYINDITKSLESQQNCSAKAVAFFMSQLLDHGETPENTVSLVSKYIQGLFANGEC